MSYAYVRRAYGVEPQVGARVRHTELKAPRDLGVIAEEDPSQSHYVMVIFDGQRHASPCHPSALDYAAHDADRLPMWVIYDRPSDYPDSFVARRWVTLPEPQFTAELRIAASVTELQESFTSLGLAKIPSHPFDDSRIVEVWL